MTDHLSRFGVAERIESIQCVDDVERSKPAPDRYLSVLEFLDIRADEAVAFEDSPDGVAAAKAAGLFCVAVPSFLTRKLPFDVADLRVASLSELSLSELLARVRDPLT